MMSEEDTVTKEQEGGGINSILDIIPPEIMVMVVFAYLHPHEVVRTETVSKAWRELTREPLLWHSYCKGKTNQVFIVILFSYLYSHYALIIFIDSTDQHYFFNF